MKLTDKVASATHTVLLYGDPKTGKTQLASELASAFDILWFDIENGYATLLKLPPQQQERIELISLPDSRVFPIAIETMLKVIKGDSFNICEEHGKVACATCKKDEKPTVTVELNKLPATTVVVVDSLTQLTNSAISHITKGQPDDYKLNYDDWAKLGVLMDKFLSQVQQAKYNIVCISHTMEVETEAGKMKLVPVSGTRNFSRNTAKYFGHVVYCEVKNNKHVFSSSSTAVMNVITGSRTDIAMEKSEKPSLLNIFNGKAVITAPVIPKVAVVGGISAGQTALDKLRATKTGSNA